MTNNNPVVASEVYAYPLLIKQLLNASMQHSATQEIVYRGDVRLSYRALRDRVGRLADALHDAGIVLGDTVAVMDWDSHRYLESYFAVPMMGAVLQTVNVRLSPEQVLYTLNHAGAKIILLNSDFLPLYREIKPHLTSVEKVIWISDEAVPTPVGDEFIDTYESMLSAASADFAFPELSEDTRATTFYTTGTTGNPKGVFFSHRQIVLHTLSVMAAMGTNPDGQSFHCGDIYMPITPMFHVHAWGMPFVATMLGVKQVYPGRYMPDKLLELIESEGVTFSHCVPTILQMLLGAPESESVDLSRWKVVIGGSALSEGLARQALKRGIDVFSGYGMSETCPVLSLSQLKPKMQGLDESEQISHRCMAGRPAPLVEIRTVDPEMNDVPADGKTAGEVVVRAPWLTQGYLGNPEASEELWAGGYLHTQDVGILENGVLKITDRIKDVIKTGGEWVSSLEIEDLLSKHDAVGEVAVVGIKDEKWGERPLAFVVTRPGNESDEDDLKQHLETFAEAGVISRYAVPNKILFVDSIPKTSVGKINKKLLRDEYGA
jgi:fatty-acyl-CoA synthase